jgi:Tfp pilus assembly protein PilO
MLDFLSSIGYRKKIVLSATLSILTMGAIVYFLIIPTMENIKILKGEVETKQVELEKNYLKGKSLKVIAEDLKKIEPQIAELKKIFIKKESAFEFITEMEKIAQNSKLEQKINLSSEEEKIGGAYKKIPIQLSTKGSFSSQIKYLSAIESLDYQINVKTLEISSGGTVTKEDGSTEDQVTMQIIADTYWQE